VPPWARLVLAAIVAVALWAHLWGVRGDLPWAYASDEGQSAVIAIRMATEGDPNPRWFGHPGSTYFYPLAAAFRIANAVDAGGSPLAHDPGLAARIGGDPGRYFVLGRLITIAYAVAALPLLFAIGRRAWDDATALAGTWLGLLSPMALEHAQMMRTDAAGLFFGLLALWLVLRVLDAPTLRAHVLAGLAIGAAVGTRYFLATLAPVLLLADVVLWWRATGDVAERGRLVRAALAGLVCVALGFVLTTPYFLLDLGTVLKNLTHEVRSEHLGADGFGFLGNLGWYATSALPATMSGGRVALALAVVEVVRAAWRRDVRVLLVVLAIATFVIAISTASLHWQRWLIQVLPLFALLAAGALLAAVRLVSRGLRLGATATAAIAVLAVALLTAAPALAYARFALAQGQPSTRIGAREWMIANLPAGSRIASDFYAAPLHDSPLHADYEFSLAAEHTLEDYEEAGYDYLVVSDAIYGRYQREPRRYPDEVAFYTKLLRDGRMVMRFTPREFARGPVITVYAIGPRSASAAPPETSPPPTGDADAAPAP
jgi:4-amino-4-deoxy-L-arabinose transferase-like glycosyltransferase